MHLAVECQRPVNCEKTGTDLFEQGLKGSDLILHAGDVGRDEVLEALEAIGPLIAIRGNIDKTGQAATLPDVQDLEFRGHSFFMLHDVKTLDIDPQGRYRVVIARPPAFYSADHGGAAGGERRRCGW